jgi:CHAT domain-containing protein
MFYIIDLLIFAGTSSVLVSLWNVNDKSAAQLMTSFYRNMEKDGMSKSAALKKARLEMIRKGFSHPYYWSTFILIGSP